MVLVNIAILNADNCSQLTEFSDRELLLQLQPDHIIPAIRQTFGQLPLIFCTNATQFNGSCNTFSLSSIEGL